MSGSYDQLTMISYYWMHLWQWALAMFSIWLSMPVSYDYQLLAMTFWRPPVYETGSYWLSADLQWLAIGKGNISLVCCEHRGGKLAMLIRTMKWIFSFIQYIFQIVSLSLWVEICYYSYRKKTTYG